MNGNDTAYEERLMTYVGAVLQERTSAADPVNVPMIRHWVEAMELTSTVHLDPDAARATGRSGVVAPAAMTQAWVMRGYAATVRPTAGKGLFGDLVDLLAEGGYTSVVATDSDLELARELVPGDRVSVEEVVESISPEKQTGLGAGRFVTTLKTYRDGSGDVVATQRWRTLRFRPQAEPEAPKAPRPRPALNRDNAFWFEAAREHRLVIQRCSACGVLRHPPGPMCPRCNALDPTHVVASGLGEVYSYVVHHHPQVPGKRTPFVIALVELEEGVRMLGELHDVDPEQVKIGLPVRVRFVPSGEFTLPAWEVR